MGIPKNKDTAKDMIQHNLIFYTTRNYMGAPKENKGSETTPQLSKAHLHPFKSSHISLVPNNPH